jgi:hypothetical protein
MDENGKPQPDVMIKKLSSNSETKNTQLEELIKKCVQLQTKDQCETAFKIYECYRGSPVH